MAENDGPPIDPLLPYLQPYVRATREHRGGFGSLLWASPRTQAIRFDAIRALVDLTGARVWDVGCGRGDLLDYLAQRNIWPAEYVGIEGVPGLAAAAREKAKVWDRSRIIEADFVADPRRLFDGAEVIVFSGSLNTLDSGSFEDVLRKAFDAANRCVVFNFLCSPGLAAADYLIWHRVGEVMELARSLSERVRKVEDYIEGDCTVVMGK